jgi:hypothetical protein
MLVVEEPTPKNSLPTTPAPFQKTQQKAQPKQNYHMVYSAKHDHEKHTP